MRHFFWPLICLSIVAFCQKTPHLLSQRQACAQFSDAVVAIDGGGQSLGTGFIVSSDGYILTALHVVKDKDGRFYSTITVHLADGGLEFAQPSPVTEDSVGGDFAVLKINPKKTLPFLQLGSAKDVVAGGDGTIIGFPFSAISDAGSNVSEKFCLSASFAASVIETRQLTVSSRAPNGLINQTNKNVSVDVVYFQGPSVKGISGSPIISRDSGTVVGIVTVKLSGIGNSLMELKDKTSGPQSNQMVLLGVNPIQSFNQIVSVLDDQLANGMGGAIGIDDPKEALLRAQKKTAQ